jgi:ribulose-phosphate 3-epimerase
MKTIIAPSLLSANFLELKNEITKFNAIDDIWFHLDIMDGHFVPNLTFGPVIINKLNQITSHPLDLHLMVLEPDRFVDYFRDAKLDYITFHWEACVHHHKLIQKIKSIGSKPGISLNPSTSIDIIPDEILQEISLILIMSVNPGFGGQNFIESSLNKVQKLAERKQRLNLDFTIQVDGGINEHNAPRLIQAGANCLVAGSFVFKSSNYQQQIDLLRK